MEIIPETFKISDLTFYFWNNGFRLGETRSFALSLERMEIFLLFRNNQVNKYKKKMKISFIQWILNSKAVAKY